MTSNMPARCCTVGVKHSGEATGEYQDISGGMFLCTLSDIDLAHRLQLRRISHILRTDRPIMEF
jgi:hypothetical protein